MEKKITLLLAVLVILFSCKKKDETATFDLGYDYFPREIGSWIIYDVDSIVHDDNDDGAGLIDTFRYQLKVVVDTEFTDLEGRLSQRIVRYKRINANDIWKVKDVWSSTVTSSTAEQLEENVRYIKFIFPPKEGEIWDGNALNDEPRKTYEYTDVAVNGSVNGNDFDEITTVEQEIEFNQIEQRLFIEKYARGVGLIYKVNNFIEIQGNEQGGVEYKEEINSYGVN